MNVVISILWIILIFGLIVFIYAAGKGNKMFDEHIEQIRCLNRYIDSNNIAMITYIGIDSDKIRQYENVLATITTFEESKIKVSFNGNDVVYDDRKKFLNDWHFLFED